MTAAFYAPCGFRSACGAWLRERVEMAPRRDATEIWVFSIGGKLPPGSIKRWVGRKPLKFFALTETLPSQVVPLPHLAPDRLPSRQELLPVAARAAETRSGLEAVAAKLRAGHSYADMDAEVDRLLGTAAAKRDSDVESEFELSQAETRREVIDP